MNLAELVRANWSSETGIPDYASRSFPGLVEYCLDPDGVDPVLDAIVTKLVDKAYEDGEDSKSLLPALVVLDEVYKSVLHLRAAVYDEYRRRILTKT